MKQLILLMILGTALVSCETTAPNRPQVVGQRNQIGNTNRSYLARVTSYWAGRHGSDRYTRRHLSATGFPLRTGVCAVDPRVIPYGSTIYYPNGACDIAVDTGRDVCNRKAARRMGRNSEQKNAIVIDKFFETQREATMWTNSNPYFMQVRVQLPVARIKPQPFKL